jgi:16S rRNA (uracil1498-N3)-methyltransferase
MTSGSCVTRDRQREDAPPRVRLFVEAPLDAGVRVELPRAVAHRLGTVLRLRPGAALELFNGRDGAWFGRLEELGKARAGVRAEERRLAQRACPDFWLLFAPLKHGRIDFLVEKATELGVGRLVPVFTAFAQSERVNLERLRARAVEAAEQCERLDVPALEPARPLGAALDAWPRERTLLVCDEAGGEPIGAVLAALRDAHASADRLALLIGPEGGLAPADRKALALVGPRHAVSLGPRILRAETAALAALACVMALVGDWPETSRN